MDDIIGIIIEFIRELHLRYMKERTNDAAKYLVINSSNMWGL